MSKDLLDEDFVEISEVPQNLQVVYVYSIASFAFFCIIWTVLRVAFFEQTLAFSKAILPKDTENSLPLLAVWMTLLFIVLLSSFLVITYNINILKENFQKDLVANIISLLMAAAFFWMLTLFAGLIGTGLTHLIFGLEEIPSLDIATILVGLGCFVLLYRFIRKRLLVKDNK